jgi:hypothetical protein
MAKAFNVAARGQNRADFFRIAINDNRTAYEFLTGLTTAVASAPDLDDVAYTLTEIEKSKPTPSDDGTCNHDWDQYECGEDLWDFLNLVAIPAGGKKKKTYYLENGVARNKSATDELILCIQYLFNDDDTTPTKIFVQATIGNMSASSGAFETSAAEEDEILKPTLGFTGAKSEVELTIPAACFRDTIVTAASVAGFTIASGLGYKRKFCEVAE